MTVSRLRRSPRNSFVSFVNYRLYAKHEVMKTTTFLQNIDSCKILNAYVYKEGASSSPLVSFLLMSYSNKFQLPSQKRGRNSFDLNKKEKERSQKGENMEEILPSLTVIFEMKANRFSINIAKKGDSCCQFICFFVSFQVSSTITSPSGLR